jgi:hypothetical protein
MTGTDLIVLAPWVVFAVALATICLLLLRARRASGARRSRRARPDPQEAKCPENNAEAGSR